MRRSISLGLIIALFGIAFNSAQAKPVNLDQWFLKATSYDKPGTTIDLAAPDFLLGKSLDTTCPSKFDSNLPRFYTFWQLLKYDRKHHIALARGSTDQESCALFVASAPAVSAPDADLSQACTGRGVCIGSTYAHVLSVYGPSEKSGKRGKHFVTSYSAMVAARAITLNHPQVQLPERITLVIDNERVSSIAIYIDEGGLF